MSVESSQLLLRVSPLPDAATIERFMQRLLVAPHVYTADLEEFENETAEFEVVAESIGDLIGDVLAFDGLPLAGLTITAAGEVSVQLYRPEESSASRSTSSRPDHAPVDTWDVAGRKQLRERLDRTVTRLAELMAGAPAPIVLPHDFAPAQARPPDDASSAQRTAAETGEEADSATIEMEYTEGGDIGVTTDGRSQQQSTRPVESVARTQRLMASPFENVATANRFLSALREVEGIIDLRAQPLRDHVLELSVEYLSVTPLEEHLAGLEPFMPRIVADDGVSITIAIGRPQQDAAPATASLPAR